jgi:hypothetical protein
MMCSRTKQLKVNKTAGRNSQVEREGRHRGFGRPRRTGDLGSSLVRNS